MSPHQDQKGQGPEGLDSRNVSLAGQTVLVARPRAQQAPTAALFEAAGARVVQFAAIEIGPPDDWRPVDQAIDRIGEFSWAVFSSSNGVRFFLGRLTQRGRKPEQAFCETKIAVIGPGTADSLKPYGLRAILTPPIYRAESLAEALGERFAEGDRILLVRASRGREVLAERLRARGADVEQVVAYSSTDASRENSAEVGLIEEMINSGKIDWIAVTSSAIAVSLARLFGATMTKSRVAAISPITAGALRSNGCRVDVVAQTHSIPGLIQAIAAHVVEDNVDEVPRR
jgi:uroporphyrinogen III methyltransferase / synthase